MDLLKHTTVEILDELDMEKEQDNPFLESIEELYGDYYEVEFQKKKISWTTYFVFGFFVYGYAKLRMLQFHYDFLHRYHDPRLWELIVMVS